MHRIPSFLLSFLLIGFCCMPLYASASLIGLPFGGKVVSVPLPCVNIPGAFQMFVLDKLLGAIPFTLSLVWAPPPLTATCLFSGKCITAPGVGAIGVGPALPPHIGQTLLGMASLTPTACIVAGAPIPGFLIKLVGTSLL